MLLIMMLAGSVGSVAFGIIADRARALAPYTLASLAQSALVYWFVEIESLLSLYVLAVLFGFGFSGVMTSLVLCVREVVPARSAGLGTAIVGTAGWIGMGSGGNLGGYCFDLTQAYNASFATASVAGFANLAILLVIWIETTSVMPARSGF